jgi:signal transduction histidine kinase
VRLQEELRAARWQLVQATAEERDRLRRDLHDGLGPLLSGAGLALEGIRQGLDQSSPTAAHVQAVGTSVRAAAGEVRRVLDGLAPEALSDHDLAAAVEQHLADVRRGGLHADLEACTGPLPPVVQEAAYRLVLEAVTNVVRHARAQHVHVRLVRDGHDVVVEVRDDGRGMPPSYVSGVGIDSMRRRAGELGGSLLVDASVPHGTLVRARLPVAP